MGRFPTLVQQLPAGQLILRELRRRDASAWRAVRARNAEWLRPWEATVPPGSDERAPSYGEMVGRFRREAREGRSIAWALVLDDRLVGQLTVANITLGSLRGASIGYWIDQQVAGRGVMPAAVALACDHCFRHERLHRIEVVIRPENTASLRVVQKLGFRYEGARPAFLHISGQWRDHEVYALTAEEAPPSLVEQLLRRHDHRQWPFRAPGHPS